MTHASVAARLDLPGGGRRIQVPGSGPGGLRVYPDVSPDPRDLGVSGRHDVRLPLSPPWLLCGAPPLRPAPGAAAAGGPTASGGAPGGGPAGAGPARLSGSAAPAVPPRRAHLVADGAGHPLFLPGGLRLPLAGGDGLRWAEQSRGEPGGPN